MASSPAVDGRFFHDTTFLSRTDHEALFAFLESVPRVEPGSVDVVHNFALSSPRAGSNIIKGRLEAAAGWPVWTDNGPKRGVDPPIELEMLAQKVSERLADEVDLWSVADSSPKPFTSLYVDRYEAGGSFVAHTDRSCYGPVIAGLSVGTGRCRLTFLVDDQVVFGETLSPRGLYAFSGDLRCYPCTHRVQDVTALRYAVSFRTAAHEQPSEPAT